MPNNIDERVVEMRIDNRQFVKGAEKTIGVLDKLKTALNFKEQTSELNSFQDAIRRVDFSGLSDAIETIGDRFTILGIMGKRAIENIADSLYNMTVHTVKSLSIDQVSEGYSKYEQKMKSVQTMMANTASKIGTDYADQAEQLESINEQMERLVFFTDETSYSFTGMSANMASFISAGIGIRDARIDMQGVAVAAGIAGSSVEQATHAMNNLSQAMAMGKLTIQDWQSLEIAGITTDEFKKVLAETAVECGKLKKVGEDMYETIAAGSQKSIQASSAGIRTLLSSGFADREVIEKTLHKYGEFSDVLNTVSDKTGVTATDLLAYLDEYEKGQLDLYKVQKEVSDYISSKELPSIDALAEAFKTLSDEQLDLGKRAFKASQEYNSFLDAINATKDAVSTGWMTTFEYIFGDYMEAKKVWTAIGTELYDIFAAGAERRNNIMEIWKEDGGRDALLESFRNIFDGFMSLIEPIKKAFKDIFGLGEVDDAAEKLVAITERFKNFTESLGLTEATIEKLRTVFGTFFNIVKILGQSAFNGLVSAFKEIKRLSSPIVNAIEKIFPSDKVQGFSGLISNLIEKFSTFLSSLKLSDRALDGIENVIVGIYNFAKKIFDTANESVFSKIISWIGKIIQLGARLVNVFFESFADGFDGKTLLTAIGNVFHEIGDTAGNIWDILSRVFTGVFGFIGKIREWFQSLGSIGETIQKIFGFLKTVIDGITQGLSEAFGDKNIGNNIIKIAAGIAILIKAFFSGRDAVWVIENALSPLKMFTSTIEDAFYQMGEAFRSLKVSIWGKVFKDFALSLLMLAAALWILSAIDINKLSNAFMALVATITAMVTAIALLNKYGGKGSKAALLGAGLLELAAAVMVLVLALALLSILNPENLTNALMQLVILIFALSTAAALLSKYAKGGNLALVGFGILEMAAGLFILASALALLSIVNPEKLNNALMQLVILIFALATAAALLSKYAKGGNLALVGFGLIEIAAGLFILAAALVMLSLADPAKISSSLLILGLALAGIAVITEAMGPKLAIVGVGLLLVAAAIAVLAIAIAALSMIDSNKLLETIIILGIGLMALTVILIAMQQALVGALVLVLIGAALALAAVGMLVFALAMQLMQGIDMLSVAEGLVAIGLALAVLAPGMIAMSLGVLGAVGLLLISIALVQLGIALNVLQGLDIASIAQGLVQMFPALVLLATVGTLLLVGGVGLAVGAVGITLFGLALYPLTWGLKQLQTVNWDEITKCIAVVGALAVAGTLLTVGSIGLIAGAAGVSLLALAMKPFTKALHEFDNIGMDTIVKFLVALGGSAVVLAALTPVLGPLGVALTLFGIAAAAAGAGIYLAGEGMEKIANSLTSIPGNTKEALLAITSGIKATIGSVQTEAENLAVAIAEGFDKVISIISSRGVLLVSAFNTIKNNSLNVIADTIASFTILGGNIDAGIANGIYERINDPVEAMHWLAYSMIQQFGNDFDINSPSKIMENLASWIPLGAERGLNNTSNIAENAMADLGAQMLSAIYPSLEILSMLLNEEYDFSPTITPIVDMSNVDSSMAAMNRIMSNANMSASVNASGIDAMVANAGRITEEMNNAMAGQSSAGDSFVINVYSQPGMDENELANAVMYKIQNGILRKGAALG